MLPTFPNTISDSNPSGSWSIYSVQQTLGDAPPIAQWVLKNLPGFVGVHGVLVLVNPLGQPVAEINEMPTGNAFTFSPTFGTYLTLFPYTNLSYNPGGCPKETHHTTLYGDQ
jgi:hypothetical protein